MSPRYGAIPGHLAAFSIDDFWAVDLVHREQPVPDFLKSRVGHLLEQGKIERLDRGKGVRLLLSQRFYRRLGKAGIYTRKHGLDRETNKALLLRHLCESGDDGCPISELQQVLPAQSREQLERLLIELRREGRVRLVGERRGARWHMEEGREYGAMDAF